MTSTEETPKIFYGVVLLFFTQTFCVCKSLVILSEEILRWKKFRALCWSPYYYFFLKHFKAFKIPTFGEMINASSKMWCEVFKFMHKDWKLHMICSGETHRWWNQNYLQSRISLSGFCSENITIWPKRSWNKNLQRNDPLMLFFVQLVRMDYGHWPAHCENWKFQ